METKSNKVKGWLRKHWLPVAVGFLGLILLVMLAIGSIRQYQCSTPIARIEPEDSLSALPVPTRLGRYREEMERIKRENIRRQRSLEHIVAMDFGSMGEEKPEAEREPELLPKESASPAEPGKERLPREREKEAPRKVKQNRPEQTSSSRLPPMEAENPFYTLKVETPQAIASGEQRVFYRAVVHGDQQVEQNGTFSLRLLEDIREGAQLIPRNSLLYGRLARAGGGRLKVLITTPGPLKLNVYDQDYQEGILYLQEEAVPSALAESRDDALNQLLVSLPYGGVASGLTGLGRNLVRKKRKQNTVFLADSYPLFVRVGE